MLWEREKVVKRGKETTEKVPALDAENTCPNPPIR